MGRPLKGWRLRMRGKTYHVIFTHRGKQVERSTGRYDPEGASQVAADIFTAVTSGQHTTRANRSRPSTSGTSLQVVAAKWLNAVRTRLDEQTVETYALYLDSHIVPHFEVLENVSPVTIADYTSKRLGQVRSQTVRHELSVLRQLLLYCHEVLTLLPDRIVVPSLGKKVRGTASKQRKRSAAPEISPDEVKHMIAHLPVRSRGKWPVRARFLVAYETGLRPSLLDVLSVPEHYTTGSSTLRVPGDDDKIGFERVVPLTKRARAALDEVAPEKGLIFGAHDYRTHLVAAAKAVLGDGTQRQLIFNGAHLRSARVTHLLERTTNVPGVQFLVGHKLMATTSRYVKPSERAARDVLDSIGES